MFKIIIIMGLFSMSKADYDNLIVGLERQLGNAQARLAAAQALKARATNTTQKNDGINGIASAKGEIARIKSEIAEAKTKRKSAK